jgi:hypothetical protein
VGYRGESAGDVLEAPTAEGPLRLELGPRSVKLTVAQRSLHVADGSATVLEHGKKRDKRTSHRLVGPLVIARDVPRDDLGVWIEVAAHKRRPRGMRRIFGVQPMSLLEKHGLAALAKLDTVVHRLRAATSELAGDIRRAVELGSAASGGLDKVLLADKGDRYVIYARRLFRDRARDVMAIHDDGRVVVPDGKHFREVVVRSRYAVTVLGDYLCFAQPRGDDVRVSIPWIEPEDRRELARRIGQLVDREAAS